MKNKAWEWLLIVVMIMFGVATLKADTNVTVKCSDLEKMETLIAAIKADCNVEPIVIPDPPSTAIVNPPIVGKSDTFKGRIVWGKGWPNHEYGSGYYGEVRMTKDNTIYTAQTNANGSFTKEIPANFLFTLSVYNDTNWTSYKWPIKMNGYHSTYQFDGGPIAEGWTRIYPEKDYIEVPK